MRGLEEAARPFRPRRLRLPQQPAGAARNRAGRLCRGRRAGPRPLRRRAHRRFHGHEHLRHPGNRAGLSPPRPATGALPPEVPLRRDAQHLFAGGFRAALSGIAGPGVRRVLGVFLVRQGVRQRGAHDRRGRLRCRGGGRRGHAVPDHALWLSFAGADFARAVPPLRCGARRPLHRRGRGLCAAGTGRGAGRSPCDAAARRRRELRRLSHVHAASRGPRRKACHAARAGIRRPGSRRHRLREPARHRYPHQRRGRGPVGLGTVRRRRLRAARPRARPDTCSARPGSRKSSFPSWRSSTASCPAARTPAASIPP